MARKQAPDSEIHKLTVAEVGRQTVMFSRKRQAVAVELAAIFAGRKDGVPLEVPLSDGVKAARSRAVSMLNGYAPPSLTLPPSVSREQELIVERDALDIVLEALSRSEVVARVSEAVQWAEDHGAEWRALCRETILTAIRLDALEQRARQMRIDAGGIYGARLALCQFVGGGGSVVDIQVADLSAAALAEGIITAAEIRKAQNVE